MLGVFDSGEGGIAALREIRSRMPCADIVFLADRKNAPYGTKTKKELLRLVGSVIERLSESGADRILMACCTASTVYGDLPRALRERAIPIIAPAAREAALATESGKIGVIATEHTVRSGAFCKELRKYRGVKAVYSLALQELVARVESGLCDSRCGEVETGELYRMLSPIREKGIDTLILGCTHFSRLENAIGRCLPRVRLISPAREGAKEIIKGLSSKGKGQTVYIGESE